MIQYRVKSPSSKRYHNKIGGTTFFKKIPTIQFFEKPPIIVHYLELNTLFQKKTFDSPELKGKNMGDG